MEQDGGNRRKSLVKFPKLETFITFVKSNNNEMEQKPRFQVVYMQEAVEFLQSLNEKVRDKIAYNIGKSMLVLDKELFKKYRHFGGCHSWIYEEKPKDTAKRNCESTRNKKRIL